MGIVIQSAPLVKVPAELRHCRMPCVYFLCFMLSFVRKGGSCCLQKLQCVQNPHSRCFW